MEHPQIEEQRIVDRYLAGRLDAADEALFEEHLFACGDCLAAVEAGEEMRRGLRAVAAEDAARATVAVGLVAWLRRPGAWLGVLVVLVLTAALWHRQAELDGLRAGATTAWTEPMDNFLVVSLGVVRADAGDAVEIRPDPGKDAVLLSLELPAVDAPRYRVTLLDAADAVLWTGDGLEPNLYDTLLIALPSSFLAPGDYRVRVTASAGGDPMGEMNLRVLPR